MKDNFALLSNKKGSNNVFALMVTAAIAISVVFIALTFTADIMEGVKDTQTADTASYNTSTSSLEAVTQLSSQGGNIGLIVGVGLLLLVLVAIFGKLAMGQGVN